jgi:predicted ester cyclase
MALSRQEMDQVIAEHFEYELNDDIDGVLATLADQGLRHDIVGWPAGASHDKAGARAFYEALYNDLSDGKVESTMRLYGDDFVVDESIWEGRAPGRPFGLEGRNRPLKFRLLHVFEFDQDGKIRTENVWIDLAAISQQLA